MSIDLSIIIYPCIFISVYMYVSMYLLTYLSITHHYLSISPISPISIYLSLYLYHKELTYVIMET